MRASQEKSKKNKKGVSFGAIDTNETMERHSNSIDKLTLLVNKLDMKLDKEKLSISPQSIRIEVEDVDRDKIIIIGTEIGPIAEITVNLIIEEGETLNITEIITQL